MASLIADTHIVIWLVTGSPRLSVNAHEALRRTIGDGFPVLISAVSVAELIYATEKARLPQEVLDVVLDGARRQQFGLKVVPFDLDMAEAMRSVPRDIVPDLPDRMIAATAISLGLSLVTADRKIQLSGVPFVW